MLNLIFTYLCAINLLWLCSIIDINIFTNKSLLYLPFKMYICYMIEFEFNFIQLIILNGR